MEFLLFMLGIFLGFVLNSGLRSYHNYRWWKVEATISNEQQNEAYRRCGYRCDIDEKAPDVKVLKYILAYPWYNNQTNKLII